MTLDEAIAKAKADGDVQLAEWLRQARGADAAAKWYTEKLRDAHRTIRKLLNENAKLRKLVRDLVTTVRGCGQDEDGYGQLSCEEVCPHWSNDGECTRLHRDQCWYEEQARELGIEVE